ncbi:putative set domain-containing protein 5 protein [Rosellinia necatrix]|uniref:Putative set domain-containing protein 5 protein n=1 Tax=Rosellinia necatrix TaxID=77044 RepID=A0A1W2TVL4_ROSNE|nr:putative set domain-containing protein 5 protein [Rosellinia necatrix]
MDSVEKLFRDLPSPAADEAAIDASGNWDTTHFNQAVASFIPSNSRDPDREIVATWIKHAHDAVTVRGEIGRLALDKAQIPDDGSAKSRQLRYHAWISKGRKDDDYPFNSMGGSVVESVGLPEGGHAFLPAELVDPKICANCAEPNADKACRGCLFKQDSRVVFRTVYCDKDCQAQHWEDHKLTCRGTKKLCRAALLIYDLFVIFQKMAGFEKQITGITEKQGITYIAHDQPNEWAFQGKPFLCHFQPDIAPSEEHALAVLFDSECQQLMATCHDLLRLLLIPLCRQVEEVQIIPRNAHRPTCDMRDNTARSTMYNQHTVLRVTLKSGEKIAIDVAGAQFGWRETIAPWQAWECHRVEGQICVEPFGTSQQMMQIQYSILAAQYVQLGESQRSSLAQKMQAAVRDAMAARQAPSAGKLYALDDAAFAACKTAMLSGAEKALGDGLREIHASKIGRCYVDARNEWRATATRRQAEALEGVWLTEEDVKKAKEEGEDLAKIYKMRCADPGKRREFAAAGLDMP